MRRFLMVAALAGLVFGTQAAAGASDLGLRDRVGSADSGSEALVGIPWAVWLLMLLPVTLAVAAEADEDDEGASG
jgi:hypothetical protein